MNRISFPTPETMTEAQLAVYRSIVSGPRGKMVGPLRAAMHNPELASAWQELGGVLRYKTSLPAHLNELAILVTARRWNSQVEWSIHKGEALKAKLSAAVIDAIGQGEVPEFTDSSEHFIYEFARQLLLFGNTDDKVYSAVLELWGEVGVVELTALVGYYSMVAMTLNVHQIPLPEGTDNALPESDGKRYDDRHNNHQHNHLFDIPAASGSEV